MISKLPYPLTLPSITQANLFVAPMSSSFSVDKTPQLHHLIFQTPYSDEQFEQIKALLHETPKMVDLDQTPASRSPTLRGYNNLLAGTLRAGLDPKRPWPRERLCELILLMIRQGAKPLHRNEVRSCDSALCQAITGDLPELIEPLIRAGASTLERYTDFSYSKPFLLSISGQNPEMLSTLLKVGCQPWEADDQGNTALHLLFTGGIPARYRSGLEEGGVITKESIAQDIDAADQRLLACSKVLLNAGAPINALNANEQSVLFYSFSYFKSTAYLIESGADVRLQNNIGRTLLHRAVMSRDSNKDKADLIQNCLSYGVPLLADYRGNTPFHFVAQEDFDSRNPLASVLPLLERADETLLNQPNDAGDTPLLIALHYQSEAMIRYLLTHSTTLNLQHRNQDGKTALDIAIGHGWAEMVELLHQQGADWFDQTATNSSALSKSMHHRNPRIRDLAISIKEQHVLSQTLKKAQSSPQEDSDQALFNAPSLDGPSTPVSPIPPAGQRRRL